MHSQKKSNNIDRKVYLTQRELAERWCMTESTISQKREEGLIPYFRLPNSARPLYPVDQIELLERNNTKNTIKEGSTQNRPSEIKRKTPVNSTISETEWRI